MPESKPKILVTGAAGYIGSHCVTRLLQQGFDVVAYDNLSTGFRESLPSGIDFIFGDVRDQLLLARVLSDKKIDAVIHFAAKLVVSESVEKPLEYYDNNIGGTLAVLKACQSSGVKKLVFSSTAAVYGNPIDPVRPCREDDLLQPLSPYGASKVMAEQMIQDFSKAGHLDYVILRYFNVAGCEVDLSNGQRTKNATHLIKVCAEAACGLRDKVQVFGNDYPTADGTGVRDYIHILDLVEAHVLALKFLLQCNAVAETLNCGYGEGSSVFQVIAAMKKVSRKEWTVSQVARRSGDVSQVVANVSKIQKILHFRPQYADLALICEHSYQWEKKQSLM